MQGYSTAETMQSSQLHLAKRPSVPAALLGDGNPILEQLLERVADLVADRVVARLVAPRHASSDEWLDTRRAAEHLGIGRDSLRRLAAESAIPTEQAGTGCKLYFRRAELDEWRCSGSEPAMGMRERRDG